MPKTRNETPRDPQQEHEGDEHFAVVDVVLGQCAYEDGDRGSDNARHEMKSEIISPDERAPRLEKHSKNNDPEKNEGKKTNQSACRQQVQVDVVRVDGGRHLSLAQVFFCFNTVVSHS
ncbi:MAG: hypothetical protein V3V49_13665, partial [Candidatus Krumholzibacteria bacterium]